MKRIFLLFFVCIATSVSCVKEESRFTVPYAPVYFKIDINGLDYELSGALSYKTFTEKNSRHDYDRFGFGGLLAVRDLLSSTLYVYDLSCPYEDSKNTLVVPSSDGKATCPKCNSVFITMYGSGHCESGPSDEPLQSYTVQSSGGGVFAIRN